MATRQSGIVLGQIRTLFNEGRIGTMTDEQLVEQFAARRAQAAFASEAAECAFEAIVLRHGPMVLSVCRRALRDPHDVDDAFQATFLILARRAGSIRKRSGLGGWLRKVAHRVAARARALSVRQVPLDGDHPVSPTDEPATIAELEDLRIAVLDEVQLLPEKYRLPVQLCYLEGRTHEEAARRLAWPVGTVRTRLTWARDRLRTRLTQRGLAVPAGFIGASLISLKARADVPAPLVKSTVEIATGRAGATAITALASHVLKGMLVSQLKFASLFVLVAGTLAGLASPFTRAQVRKTAEAAQAQNERPKDSKADANDDPAPAREVGTVFFRVVDRVSRQPLPGVRLTISINGKVEREQITEESGRIVIRLPKAEPESLTVTAHREGCAPIKVYLGGNGARDTEIPRSYTLVMDRGSSIGGIVNDEEGRPIEGVNVSLYENSPDASAGRPWQSRSSSPGPIVRAAGISI